MKSVWKGFSFPTQFLDASICSYKEIFIQFLYFVIFTVASGRLLLGFRKWYYNMCGFNKLGKLKK